MNLHRYWVNRWDSVGESRGSYGFNSQAKAREFLIQIKEQMVKGEFARLIDNATGEQVVLQEVKK